MTTKIVLTRRPGLAITLGLFLAALVTAGGTALAVNGPGDSGMIYTDHKDVARAQAVLFSTGYLRSDSFKEGDLDRATIHAIKAFQAMHMIPTNGWLDSETFAELMSHGGALDRDLDNVADDIDQCPDTPQGTRVDARGCPMDQDNDTVADSLDRCPDTPWGARVDAQGCPMDADHDAVYDGLDRCPGTPVAAMVDSEGCPIDSDGDMVFDGLDRCPDTARGTRVDAQGCPEGNEPSAFNSPSPSPQHEALILQNVTFEPNTATLTSESKAALDEVAAMLKARPLASFEIAGYTDDSSSPAYNLHLSQRRADAVRRYLIAQGVAGDRLQAHGYGEDNPIADNDTPQGRAANRRVEIAEID